MKINSKIFISYDQVKNYFAHFERLKQCLNFKFQNFSMAIVLGSKRKTFANENFAELDDFSEMTKNQT